MLTLQFAQPPTMPFSKTSQCIFHHFYASLCITNPINLLNESPNREANGIKECNVRESIKDFSPLSIWFSPLPHPQKH